MKGRSEPQCRVKSLHSETRLPRLTAPPLISWDLGQVASPVTHFPPFFFGTFCTNPFTQEFLLQEFQLHQNLSIHPTKSTAKMVTEAVLIVTKDWKQAISKALLKYNLTFSSQQRLRSCQKESDNSLCSDMEWAPRWIDKWKKPRSIWAHPILYTIGACLCTEGDIFINVYMHRIAQEQYTRNRGCLWEEAWGQRSKGTYLFLHIVLYYLKFCCHVQVILFRNSF